MQIRKSKIYNLFLLIVFLDFFVINILQLIVRLTNYSWLTSTFKIFTILEFSLIVFYIIISKKIVVNGLTIIFVFSLLFGIALGFINKQFNFSFISHIYEFTMPILSISFAKGIYIYAEQHKEIYENIDRILIFNSKIYILCSILFRFFYILGMTNYNAYGAPMPIYSLPYLFFMNKDNRLRYGMLMAIILSGKRAILVQALVVFSMYIFFSKKDHKERLQNLIYISISVLGGIYFFRNTTLFNRILLTINNLFGESKDMYLATGGRNIEFDVISTYLNNNPINWIIGNGFGINLYIDGVYRHYSHFTPLGYTMVSGVIFTILLYVYIVYSIIILLLKKTKISILYMNYLVIFIVGSFFGATLFNEQKLWIIIGIALVISGQDKSYIKL